MADNKPQLDIPGRPRDSNNPLVMITEAMNKQTEVITQGLSLIVRRMGDERHVYALEPIENEHGKGFLSYCLSCSNTQQRFVHPCAIMGPELLPIPPSTMLVEGPPETDTTATPTA